MGGDSGVIRGIVRYAHGGDRGVQGIWGGRQIEPPVYGVLSGIIIDFSIFASENDFDVYLIDRMNNSWYLCRYKYSQFNTGEITMAKTPKEYPKPESELQGNEEPAQESGADDKKDVLTPELVDNKEPNPESDEKALVPVSQDNNLPAPLTDEQIEEAVTKINAIVTDEYFKSALKIGKYILVTFFGNDIKLASSQNPKKVESFRKLAEHKDIKLSYSHLSQMVRIAAQEEYLLEKIGETKLEQLHYSHRVELLKVPKKKKIALVDKVAGDKLSTRKLKNEIKGSKPKTAKSEISRLNSILKSVSGSYKDVKVTKTEVKRMGENEVVKLQSKVTDSLKQIDAIKKNIESIQKVLTGT